MVHKESKHVNSVVCCAVEVKEKACHNCPSK